MRIEKHCSSPGLQNCVSGGLVILKQTNKQTNKPAPKQETQVWSLSQEDSLEKEKAIHSSILAWKSHEQRSVAGYSPWGCKRDRHDLVTKQQLTVCISQEIQNLMADKGILPLKSIAAKFFPVVYTW